MSDLPTLGQGFYWQALKVGQKFKTYRRTVGKAGAIKGRVVPAALTYGLIEGPLFQSMIQGMGLASLEVHKKALKPVSVGDSIWTSVEVAGIKPASKANRAVVSSEVEVFNQANEAELAYDIVRMLAGR